MKHFHFTTFGCPKVCPFYEIGCLSRAFFCPFGNRVQNSTNIGMKKFQIIFLYSTFFQQNSAFFRCLLSNCGKCLGAVSSNVQPKQVVQSFQMFSSSQKTSFCDLLRIFLSHFEKVPPVTLKQQTKSIENTNWRRKGKRNQPLFMSFL